MAIGGGGPGVMGDWGWHRGGPGGAIWLQRLGFGGATTAGGPRGVCAYQVGATDGRAGVV